MASSQTASISIDNDGVQLVSDSLNTPLIADINGPGYDGDSSEKFKKVRSFTGPVKSISGDADTNSSRFNRPYSAGHVIPFDQYESPFSREDAFDGSGTVVRAKSGFTPRSTEIPGFIPSVPYLRDQKRTKYEEAALYVQEGIDNDKFSSHPNGVFSKIAFNIAHNPWFYISEFIVCCLLLGLAIIEEPAWVPIPAKNQREAVLVHTLLEMLFLSVIAFNILLRFIWMKPRTFLKQRSTLTAIVMVIMFFEAMVVLVRQESHFRISRCLRPIFFIDSYIMHGVRRVLRQIVQCIKPIADVMILLFFMVAIFALAGYYLFAHSDSTFFDSYLKAFVSLFITLTTANHPDVFMEAYVKNRASPLFFIIYLFVTLYFFSNVLLAVVYAHFSDADKDKFRKLYLHKREALRLAFFVLTKRGEGIDIHDFTLFMLEYNPRIPEYQVMCIYKALQDDPTKPQETLCLEEFLKFYDIQNLQWSKLTKEGKSIQWYAKFDKRVQPIFKFIDKVVGHQFFNSVFALVVIANTIYLIVYSLTTSFHCASDGANTISTTDLPHCDRKRFTITKEAIYGSFLFTFIYIFELSLRMLAVGPKEYLKKSWNIFDLVVISLSFILLIIETTSDETDNDWRSFLIVVRPIKLFRLLRLKKRYYDIMNTVFFIGYRLLSVLLLLVVIFYFYAIIGMEFFRGKVYVGCCEKALFGVSSYYQTNLTGSESTVYWLNNFDNIYQSYVILYEEMIVNNWFVQMEGFVSETNILTRLFFFAFWITTTICLSVVIAYIVDAFVFRIQSSNRETKCENHPNRTTCACNKYRKKRKPIRLVKEEINSIKYQITRIDEINRTSRCLSMSYYIRKLRRINWSNLTNNNNNESDNEDYTMNFIGKRLRTREDLNLQMHKDELKGWITDREAKWRALERSPQKKTSFVGVVWTKFKQFALFLLE